MATYKVPQDVEADDKLLGPFNFRQFIYLLIVAALIALAWALAQIFPLFAIIPVLPALFLLILALPLRKDQPMETYIAALIQFYTKPTRRFWNPGQRESTITITAPKIVEKQLTKNLTEEEASHRLSFLANVVDSEGYSIKNSLPAPTTTPVREEYLAEANNAPDIFENYESTKVVDSLESDADRRRKEIVEQMRASINAAHSLNPAPVSAPSTPAPSFDPSVLNPAAPVAPTSSPATPPLARPTLPPFAPYAEPIPDSTPPKEFVELSKNDAYSVATLSKVANRRASRAANDNEVYVSLH